MRAYKVPVVNIWIDLDSIIAIGEVYYADNWDTGFTITCKFLNNVMVINAADNNSANDDNVIYLEKKEVIEYIEEKIYKPLINEWLKSEE